MVKCRYNTPCDICEVCLKEEIRKYPMIAKGVLKELGYEVR